MARARNIKPGFFLNDDLAEIEPLGRLLFVGLWCIADREGRLEDRPKKIKAAVLPYDDCDMDRLLQDLYDAGFICRYVVDGQNYIQITNFSKHQNPHPKEAASIIPAIPELATEKQVASKLQESDKPITKNADSPIPLILISDSLTPLPHVSPDGEVNKQELESNTRIEYKPRSPFKSKKQEKLFDQFWDKYPKKKAKGDAEKAWVKITPDDILFKTITKGVERGRASPEWKKKNGEFIPYPATWLNGKRWTDENELQLGEEAATHDEYPDNW